MMWNRIFALLAAACLAVSLAACGGTAPGGTSASTAGSQTGSPIVNDTGDEAEKPAQAQPEYRAMWNGSSSISPAPKPSGPGQRR